MRESILGDFRREFHAETILSEKEKRNFRVLVFVNGSVRSNEFMWNLSRRSLARVNKPKLKFKDQTHYINHIW